MASGATHTLLTPTIIARTALMLLKNNLVMGSQVYRAYEAEFPGSPKKGGTVTIRKPNKFVVSKTRVRATSTISEQSITLTVATQAHVSWSFHMSDLSLTIEEYTERYIRPAASVLSNTVDGDLCGLYTDVYNTVWESTGFVTPSTFMAFGKAMQRLDEEGSPPDERTVVLNPAAHWSMANALSSLYVQEAAGAALRKGFLGRIANCDVFMDQNIKTHTHGHFHDTDSTGSDMLMVVTSAATLITGIVAGATANKSLEIMGMRTTASLSHVFRIGDWFKIQNVYAVNPMSGESTGTLRQFVVTADVSGDSGTASGTATARPVFVEPNMINTGPYKTVNTTPKAGNNIVYVYQNAGKNYPMNLAFHKNAFALVMVPLEKPDGAWGSSITEDGFSIRIVKAYEIDEDDEVVRLDILYGVKTIYPELAVRILGAEA